MPKPINVAVLHDATEFGGHERAFLTWLPTLLRAAQVARVEVWTPDAAKPFRAALAELESSKLRVTTHRFQKRRAEPFLAPVRVRYGLAARRFVSVSAADVIVLLQGRIENLAVPMLWLSRQTKIVNYVPMAHLGAEMGRGRLASMITDGVKRFYYARPQHSITVSKTISDQLQRAGAKGRIHIVENIPSQAAQRADGATEEEIETPAERRTALYIGRFESGQKGLDRLVAVLRKSASDLAGWRFLFVGRGSAEPMLRDLLASGGVLGEIRDWTDDPVAVLRLSDVLLLPSRYEGVPLIMLEAMQVGTPIIAADIDVFREYLPSAYLYDFSRAFDISIALDRAVSEPALSAYRAHAARIVSGLDPVGSGEAFLRALLIAARNSDLGSRP